MNLLIKFIKIDILIKNKDRSPIESTLIIV